MAPPLLAAKCRPPRPRAGTVPRRRLAALLDDGLSRDLALVCAGAGFGKTTLLAHWAAGCGMPAAWLSLDADDQDPVRFLAYLSAALRTVGVSAGPDPATLLDTLRPPRPDAVLADLLDACDGAPAPFVVVLDDYHAAASPGVDRLLTVLVDRRAPTLHLAVATREDPHLPLARLRSKDELTEVRSAQLRFTPEETARFFEAASGRRPDDDELAALDDRVEGWVAGLQLTAIARRGGPMQSTSFARGDRFVLDYLLEDVFAQQPAPVRDFLLRTAVLQRMCGPLCDALGGEGTTGGQDMLERLDRANLFVVPLDDERTWYRYHHLFAELLRRRLDREPGLDAADLHRRACDWFASAGLGLEAFRHAVAAGDVDRADRLLDGPLMPLHHREVAHAAVEWLSTLPATELDRRPDLWVKRATISLAQGRTAGVEDFLRAAEAALSGAQRTDQDGRIATARATLALTRYDPEAMTSHALAALDALAPDDHAFRSAANAMLGSGYQVLGRRADAARAYREALALARSTGDVFSAGLAVVSLGEIRELDLDPHGAVAAYDEGLALAGEHPLPSASEAMLGRARIEYEWDHLDAAEDWARRALALAHTYEAGIDRFLLSELLLARIALARGRVAAATTALGATAREARRGGFTFRLPEVAAVRAAVALARGDMAAATRLADESGSPLLAARALFARGRADEARAGAERWLATARERSWPDEVLRARLVQAPALRATGDRDGALAALDEALLIAAPAGLVRSFVDAGPAVAALLREAAAAGGDEASRLLGALAAGHDEPVEPLSRREREVLALVAAGLSNREVAERLSLALDSVKGHNRRIFEKLGVRRRTEAVARARELGIV